jgi:hypothetical protein
MPKPAAVIQLSDGEKKILRQWLCAGTSEHRRVERARIILLANQGQTTQQIAQVLLTRPARVSTRKQLGLRHVSSTTLFWDIELPLPAPDDYQRPRLQARGMLRQKCSGENRALQAQK